MNNFHIHSPESLEEASRVLSQEERALPFAGGTDLLGLMKDNVVSPARLVNLKSLPIPDSISYTPGEGLRIGALVPIAEIAAHPDIRERYTILAQAAKEVASPQLRGVGTLGGNLCQRPRCWYFRGDFPCLRKGGEICYAYTGESKYHCITGGGPCLIVHPSDTAVALKALDARVFVFNGLETRTLPISEFFILPEEDAERENILKPGEIVTQVEVPDLPRGTVSGYVKHKERAVWDFAVVSVGAVLSMEGSTLASGRLAFGGVAPIPWEEAGLNQKLKGMPVKPERFSALAEMAFQEAEPLEKNAYKVPLARNLLKRLLEELTR
jgi:xanthine dehydrogenase YagS FAD-binding subunit